MLVVENKYENNGLVLNSLEVVLGETTLLILEGYGAFVMCGALDVDMYNTAKMINRGVACAKAVGVRTLDELFNAPIYQANVIAQQLGWETGMTIHEAFKILSKKE